MLSRAQQILLKRAQREAGLPDEDYRDALEAVTGLRTSTDPHFIDRDLDKVIAYFEAIYWRAVDAGQLQPAGNVNAVFRQRGYWATKNTATETSRDRFNGRNERLEIAALEAALEQLGFGPAYTAAIHRNVCKGQTGAHALHLYKAALERTVKAKSQRPAAANNPF